MATYFKEPRILEMGEWLLAIQKSFAPTYHPHVETNSTNQSNNGHDNVNNLNDQNLSGKILDDVFQSRVRGIVTLNIW